MKISLEEAKEKVESFDADDPSTWHESLSGIDAPDRDDPSTWILPVYKVEDAGEFEERKRERERALADVLEGRKQHQEYDPEAQAWRTATQKETDAWTSRMREGIETMKPITWNQAEVLGQYLEFFESTDSSTWEIENADEAEAMKDFIEAFDKDDPDTWDEDGEAAQKVSDAEDFVDAFDQDDPSSWSAEDSEAEDRLNAIEDEESSEYRSAFEEELKKGLARLEEQKEVKAKELAKAKLVLAAKRNQYAQIKRQAHAKVKESNRKLEELWKESEKQFRLRQTEAQKIDSALEKDLAAAGYTFDGSSWSEPEFNYGPKAEEEEQKISV